VKRDCSICGKHLEETEAPSQDSMADTVCDECAQRLLAECGVELGRYLEGIGAPVMLFDSDGVVVAASPEALDTLGMEASEVESRLCGDVFGCVHASLPGGCGKTVHCRKCGLRRRIVATTGSRTPKSSVPVRLKTGDPDDPTWLGIVVTTEYFAGVVMMRIDEFTGRAKDASPDEDT